MVFGKDLLKNAFDFSALRSEGLYVPFLANAASLSKKAFGKYFLTT
jgi:hypothetical protein